MTAPAWLTEGASDIRKAQIEKDWASAQRLSRKGFPVAANTLAIGIVCDSIQATLGGQDQ